METEKKTTINIQVIVRKPIDQVWEAWTKPEHIKQWNFAAESWHCPKAENDLKPDGKFSWRMEAKDGSMGFDFEGQYERVERNKELKVLLGDGRTWTIQFEEQGDAVLVTEVFEIEDENTMEQQRGGWQAILDNFKKYVEGLG